MVNESQCEQIRQAKLKGQNLGELCKKLISPQECKEELSYVEPLKIKRNKSPDLQEIQTDQNSNEN
jgi:hypothetical protein